MTLAEIEARIAKHYADLYKLIHDVENPQRWRGKRHLGLRGRIIRREVLATNVAVDELMGASDE